MHGDGRGQARFRERQPGSIWLRAVPPTSMGRLTLNVLLSFAQFEREVTSERIRDKVAASKRKGLWVGGMAPLGYDTKDRNITVNEVEAERVRVIFRRYLKVGSLNLLMADLRKRDIVSKIRKLKTGETVGDIPSLEGPWLPAPQPILRWRGVLQRQDFERRSKRLLSIARLL